MALSVREKLEKEMRDRLAARKTGSPAASATPQRSQPSTPRVDPLAPRPQTAETHSQRAHNDPSEGSSTLSSTFSDHESQSESPRRLSDSNGRDPLSETRTPVPRPPSAQHTTTAPSSSAQVHHSQFQRSSTVQDRLPPPLSGPAESTVTVVPDAPVMETLSNPVSSRPAGPAGRKAPTLRTSKVDQARKSSTSSPSSHGEPTVVSALTPKKPQTLAEQLQAAVKPSQNPITACSHDHPGNSEEVTTVSTGRPPPADRNTHALPSAVYVPGLGAPSSSSSPRSSLTSPKPPMLEPLLAAGKGPSNSSSPRRAEPATSSAEASGAALGSPQGSAPQVEPVPSARMVEVLTGGAEQAPPAGQASDGFTPQQQHPGATMQYPAWATQRTPGYYYATPMQQFAPVPFNGASMVSPAAQYLASYTSSVREQGLVPGATPLWQHNTPHSSHSPPTAEEMAHMTPQVAPLAALHPPDIWMPPSLPAVFAGAGCESHFSKLQMVSGALAVCVFLLIRGCLPLGYRCRLMGTRVPLPAQMLQDRLAKEESARIYAQHLANERAALLDVEKRSAEAAVLGAVHVEVPLQRLAA
ncbi:hypothetical protein CYMTET_8140 [Cymbomonas tetramitiformis]|uniref:Uncharacterized protein n=1 Tax=Cymbomonas tetramitiformis TaxID=36881 RepID=A0AAE0GTM6_9CHLO|nr:hypothetical protein CYMTET_8140 [Cymbomonas tetramitiformis]